MNLNPYQKNILRSELLYDPSAIGCIGGTVELSGDIRLEEFPGIINDVLRLTPSIRLRLSRDEQLYESEYTPYEVPFYSAESGKEEAYRIAEKLMRTRFGGIYDTALYEFAIISYSGGGLIFLKLDHLIADSVTLASICRWADRAYMARMHAENTPLPLPYPVYRQMTDRKREQARQYFAKHMKGETGEVHLEMQPAGCRAGRIFFHAPLLQKHMTAQFVLACSLYLATVQGVDEITVGFVLGNRNKDEMEMPGMFANTLPMRVSLKNKNIEEILKTISWDVISLMRFGQYSLDDLREDGLCTGQPYEVSLSYRFGEYISRMDMGFVTEIFNGCLDVPLRISAQEEEDRLGVEVFYKKELFSEEQIRNMAKSITSILEKMKPDQIPADISVLSEYDKKMYRALNDTDKPAVWGDPAECFRAHVLESPQRRALSWDGGNETAAELYERAARIAEGLKRDHIPRVGIRMPRCREMEEMILGSLLAGSAFLILRPGEEDGGLCDRVYERDDVDAFFRETGKNGMDALKTEQDIAYYIRTSGSTGEPKCIGISKMSLMRRLEWAHEKYGLNGTILQKTVNTFDVSVWESLSVIFGAKLFLMKDGDEKFPDRIAGTIAAQKVEKVHFVPSMLRYFLKYLRKEKVCLPSLKEVYVSGEKLESADAKLFFEVLPGRRLINYYGPAECTIDVTSYEVKEGDIPGDIPIGKPAFNTRIQILNDQGRVLPVDTAGEICIYGSLVGQGYTSGVKGGFFESDGEKAYRTGDLGYLGRDGNLYFIGRKDRQVKVRGIRLELSAIQDLILEDASVSNAQVFAHKDRLICCYSGKIDESAMRGKIARKLSPYAVPSRFIKLDQMPRTQSGKTDINALKSFVEEEEKNVSVREEISSGRGSKKALSEEESLIAKEVSRYVSAGPDDNLFQAGLDSLSVLEITDALREKGLNIHSADFYEGLSVCGIAAHLAQKTRYSWLKKNDSETLLIGFAYAGGGPQQYAKLAGELSCDMIGIYPSVPESHADPTGEVRRLMDTIPWQEYRHILVMGQCIGCMDAILAAGILQERADALILAAPSVRPGRKAQRSVWRGVPDAVLKAFLKEAGCPGRIGKAMLERFRCETDAYFENDYSICPVISRTTKTIVVIGGKDLFTLNRKQILDNVRRLCPGGVKAILIKSAGHYLSENNAGEMARIIRKSTDEI